jgi:hypothetical protein
VPVYTTRDIYIKALRLLNQSGYKKPVRNLAVSVYDLIPSANEQMGLFSSPTHAVAEAMDQITGYPPDHPLACKAALSGWIPPWRWTA